MKGGNDFKYLYGPVPSWRLGRSLGVDLISGENICSFDCIYCQLGRTTRHIKERGIFVRTKDIFEELDKLSKNVMMDYITLSGTGEPTLALNLGEVIRGIKKRFDVPVAVLTNSSLFSDPAVRKDLSFADLVVAKLDAVNDEVLAMINRPVEGIFLEDILRWIKVFAADNPDKLALQTMFVKKNKRYAPLLAKIAKMIRPKEVQVNTPLRPCAVKPLPPDELAEIKELFYPLRSYSVYDVMRPKTKPMSVKQTKKRRPVI